ncbi:MAG TPA: DNA-3-methyladenine glycosylase [Ktedonobacterales bacterium]|nr:DNA-3-methyladenine glycosylase [Ktedonobacterales bacterium]
MAKVSRAFFEQPTLELARALIGVTLLRATSEGVSGGVIVETEGYLSASDPAAHGYLRPTPRTRIMYGPPGFAYIYFSYGMHCCLNISTEPEGVGAAVLVRAIQPTVGLEFIRQRRGAALALRDLARGPGRVCAALGLSLAENGLPLTGEALWLDDEPTLAPDAQVANSTRIGISVGTDLPWRWYLTNSPFVSGPRSLNSPGREAAHVHSPAAD